MVARLAIAAPASGHGKTTLATGLMAALRRAGHVVSGHKIGPDYIDPGYHALATGRPGRNLDPWLVGEDLMNPLLRHGCAGADVAIIEGVMGLYDGQLGTDGFASTAHVAAITKTPVVLVVDISHASRSIAATIHGMAHWSGDSTPAIAGVVLNKAGSQRHAREVLDAIGDTVPVLGVLRRDDGVQAPSRHLGLIPASERDDAAAALDRLAALVGERIDLEAVMRIAQSAPPLPGPNWSPPPLPRTGGRIAVAGGRAFTFRYAETTEIIEAAGAEVVEFDPLRDEALPLGTTGLYLGGGFPEMHAGDLAANTPLLDAVRRAVTAGLPTVAECAGLLYLSRSISGPDRVPLPMVGAIAVEAAMADRLTLAYRQGTAPGDDLLSRAGESVRGHEFHRTEVAGDPGDRPAWWLQTATGPTPAGIASGTLHASYLHVHWAGHPHLAHRFVKAAQPTLVSQA